MLESAFTDKSQVSDSTQVAELQIEAAHVEGAGL